MSHDKSDRNAHADVIVELDADITVLTHGYGVRGTEIVRDWLGPASSRTSTGISPCSRDSRFADCSASQHRTTSICKASKSTRPNNWGDRCIIAVDLPSNPSAPAWTSRRPHDDGWRSDPRARWTSHWAISTWRNSAALQLLFPQLEHAWSRLLPAGADIPRLMPIYHIDHILVADWLMVQRDETATPASAGIGCNRCG